MNALAGDPVKIGLLYSLSGELGVTENSILRKRCWPSTR